MYIVVCGGGKVGSLLAKDFSKKEYKVVLIERRPERCKRILDESEGLLVINGDACDVRYLEESGASQADVVLAVTGDDDDNLVICQLAKEIFKVPRTVARVNNPRNEKIFNILGVDASLSYTTIFAKLIEEEAVTGDLVTIQAFKKGKLALVEMDLPSNTPIIGRKISELGLPRDCVLVAVVRGEEIIIPRGSTVLEKNDLIIAFTSLEKEKTLKGILSGGIKPEACEL